MLHGMSASRPAFPMHVSVEEARALLAGLLPDPSVETVPLVRARSRTLAADLAARVSWSARPWRARART